MNSALSPLIEGLLALAVVPPAAAQTNPRKKPVADEATPKKQARPKTAPEASPETDASVEKPRAAHTGTLPAKVKKADMVPEISPSAKAAAAPNASIAPEEIMIGSSDGRTYRGQKRNGVSVFDFTMPRTPAKADPQGAFIGYARVSGLRD
jgi:hypothetical protein